MHRTIISFVQPQPNSIQNKNNPIGCGTAPGNLVLFIYQAINWLARSLERKLIRTRLPGAVPQPIGLFLFCIEFGWG